MQALLWFVMGRAMSLMVVTAVSLLAALGLLVVALAFGAWWMSIICGFAVLASLNGLRSARVLLRLQDAPRRKEAACPSCGAAPPTGEFWLCGSCRGRFDTFAHDGTCPACGNHQHAVPCPRCGRRSPCADWYPAVIALTSPEGEPDPPHAEPASPPA